MDNEKILLKEIDLAQDVIKRMANNSFIIKGWTITLVLNLPRPLGRGRFSPFHAARNTPS